MRKTTAVNCAGAAQGRPPAGLRCAVVGNGGCSPAVRKATFDDIQGMGGEGRRWALANHLRPDDGIVLRGSPSLGAGGVVKRRATFGGVPVGFRGRATSPGTAVAQLSPWALPADDHAFTYDPDKK